MIGLLLLNTFAASPTKGLQPWIYELHHYEVSSTFPNERWPLPHWRKRLGDELELLLADSLGVGQEAARYAFRT